MICIVPELLATVSYKIGQNYVANRSHRVVFLPQFVVENACLNLKK
jgi:hypothetical protein